MSRKVFTIVVPVYYNELNLPETIPQLLAIFDQLPHLEGELVLVDDGSGDRSLDVARDWQQRDERITVVKLTRNFGTMSGLMAGFSVARGDCIGMIAADLQDPPELFLDMVRQWEGGVKSVFAVRADREESATQKFFSNAYYALIRRFAIKDYPSGGFDFFLVDRQVVDEVMRVGEKNTNVFSLLFWLGHRSVMLPYVRRRREKGVSRWTMSKKIKLFIDSFVAFSYVPIRALSVTGFVVALSAFAYAMYVLYARLMHNIPVQGYAPIVMLLALFSGIQMTMLGVLGEYLWRALDETRRRPAFVIDDVYPSGRSRAGSSGDGLSLHRGGDERAQGGTRPSVAGSA